MSASPSPGLPTTIVARDDARIAPFRNVRDRDLHGQSDVFIAESPSVVRRLLAIPNALRSLLVTPRALKSLGDDLKQCRYGGDIFVADLDLMCEISGFHIHRGVLGVGERAVVGPAGSRQIAHLVSQHHRPFVVAADRITHVDNIGSLFRIAAGFGANAVVLSPGCCDPLYRKSIRVSMGHVLSVPWSETTVWPDDLITVRDACGARIIALESGAGGTTLWDVEFTTVPAILVVGSERHGISPEVLAVADVVAEVPMGATVPSLNVINALSIASYEIIRQRGGLR